VALIAEQDDGEERDDEGSTSAKPPTGGLVLESVPEPTFSVRAPLGNGFGQIDVEQTPHPPFPSRSAMLPCAAADLLHGYVVFPVIAKVVSVEKGCAHVGDRRAAPRIRRP
jgi:hypothetical protein